MDVPSCFGPVSLHKGCTDVWLKQSDEEEVLTVFGRNTRRDLMTIIQRIKPNQIHSVQKPLSARPHARRHNPSLTGVSFQQILLFKHLLKW
ncbi:hypothetical protein QQF64_033670 [Cirrhinus molitorella]|uniref:Uncharacterized protein n=2 Tax=Cirrhinus molitorella TaxID=172907 RepID=A0AA88TTJ9_9TELE|nr:hypothetical protein Q8A67_007180 [Cirrhinus molitorella]